MSKHISLHAAALYNLGFEPMEEAEQVFLSHRRDRRVNQVLGNRKLSKRDRRKLEKELSTPCFVLVHTPRVATYATDEMGTHWCVSELIDPWELTSIGFEDDTNYSKKTTASLPELLPNRLH